jgi:replication factor C small subunit
MALAIAHELYGESRRENTLELNASDERGINTIREIVKEYARTTPMGKAPFKLVILDEADNMTSDAQQALRRMMEMYATTTRFILIANYASGIIEPIQSRCGVFRFVPLGRDLVVGRLLEIASMEGLNVGKEALETIWEITQGDMRKAINILQIVAASSREVTPEAVYRAVGYVEPGEVVEVIRAALGGDVVKARDKLRSIMYEDGVAGVDIVRLIQRNVLMGKVDLPEEAKAEVAELAAEIDFRLTEGSDEEIQLSALLARLSLIGRKYGLATEQRRGKK